MYRLYSTQDKEKEAFYSSINEIERVDDTNIIKQDRNYVQLDGIEHNTVAETFAIFGTEFRRPSYGAGVMREDYNNNIIDKMIKHSAEKNYMHDANYAQSIERLKSDLSIMENGGIPKNVVEHFREYAVNLKKVVEKDDTEMLGHVKDLYKSLLEMKSKEKFTLPSKCNRNCNILIFLVAMLLGIIILHKFSYTR